MQDVALMNGLFNRHGSTASLLAPPNPDVAGLLWQAGSVMAAARLG
jgi:hypothetical protein